MAFRKTFRAAVRFSCIGAMFGGAFLDFVFRLWLRGQGRSITARAKWMRSWAVRFLRILNVRVRFEGRPPRNGMLVSNHLSYLDIIVLGSLEPLVFVSKSEVASWPVIGPLTRIAGTLYVVRARRTDVRRLGEDMVKVVSAGVVVTVFPEGTSSDGSSVLPFHSSLLAPAEEHHWPLTPAWIHYSLPEGSVADDVCYWRDMVFFPHFLKLLSKPHIDAFVRFGTPLAQPGDRKEMARELHAEVCRFKREHLEQSGGD